MLLLTDELAPNSSSRAKQIICGDDIVFRSGLTYHWILVVLISIVSNMSHVAGR